MLRRLLSHGITRALLLATVGAVSLIPGVALLLFGNPFTRGTLTVTPSPDAVVMPVATAIVAPALAVLPPPRLLEGDRIAYLQSGSLYVATSGTQDPVPLTSGITIVSTPVWSPDGKHIAFVGFVSGGPIAPFVIKADGSGLMKIAAIIGGGTPSFSPQSDRLAFAAIPAGGSLSVAVVNVDGSGLAYLSSGRGTSVSPAWSPDGSRIAFLSDRDLNIGGATGERGRDLYVMNPDGSNVQRVTTSQWRGNLDLAGPSWSADGSRLAALRFRTMTGLAQSTSATSFQTPIATEAEHLYVVNADTAATVDLTPSSTSGVWSPDGRTLAFMVTRIHEDRPDLGLIGADGTNLRVLTPPEDVARWFGLPSWSPGGRMLAVAAQLKDGSWTIQGIDASTGVISALTATSSSAQSAPAWALR